MAKKKTNGAPTTVLDIPCEFGGVSIGESSARLGVRINRSVLNINAADEAFCGHRLSGLVLLGGHDDAPGQGTLWDDLEHRIDGSFDCKRLGISPEQISTGLTFSLVDVDISELAKFSKGIGRLVIRNVAAIPEDAPDEDHPEDVTKGSPQGTLKAEGPWRDFPLDKLFKGAIREALWEAGIHTVGELSNYTATDKRLTDISGIGPGKATQIEDRMLGFWKSNPDLDRTEAATT